MRYFDETITEMAREKSSAKRRVNKAVLAILLLADEYRDGDGRFSFDKYPELVLHHIKQLHLRLCVEYLEKVSEDAECSEKDGPWDVCAEYVCDEIYTEENSDPCPELERV